jgi:Plasma-membrane choline transporter
MKRTLTTSFGSICFGSLLVAIIQALRALANTARSHDDSILLCLAECILACIAGLIEYFNKVSDMASVVGNCVRFLICLLFMN